MNRTVFLKALHALAILCAAEASPVSARPVIITGIVRHKSGNDLARASLVAAYPSEKRGAGPVAETQSLINGSFLLRLPAPGTYLVIAASGRHSEIGSRVVAVPAGGLDGVALIIGDNPSSAPPFGEDMWETVPAMRLSVVDAAGSPVTRGKLQVWVVWAPVDPAFRLNGEGTSTAGIWTEAPARDGAVVINTPQFFYRHIPARVGIAVRSALYGTGRVMLKSWPDGTLKIVLHWSASLEGAVVDGRGEPVAGADVRVTGMDPALGFRFLQGWAWTVTGEDGTFKIPSLFDGRYGVQAAEVYRVPGGMRFVTIPPSDEGRKAPFAAPLKSIHVTIRYEPLALSTTTSLYAFGLPSAQPAPPGFNNNGYQPGQGAVEAREAFLPGWTLTRKASVKPIPTRGTVQTGSAGGPLANLTVELFREHGDYPLDVATTGSDGSFSMEAPGGGHFRLVVDQLKLIPKEHPIEIDEKQTAKFALKMWPRPVVDVSVVTADGRPATPPFSAWVATASGGTETTIEAPRDIPWKCEWSGDGLPTQGEPLLFGARSATLGVGAVELDAWPTAPVTVRLMPGLTLLCRVLDTAGRPVAHAQVSLLRRFHGEKNAWDSVSSNANTTPPGGMTDATGIVRCDQLLPGLYEIQAEGQARHVTLSVPFTEVTIQPGGH